MSAKAQAHVIASWINDLAILTAGTAPLADSKAKTAALTLAMTQEFPVGAFTKDSLYAMSRQFKFLPSHAELSKALGGWWDDHRPPVPMLKSDIDDPSLDDNDRTWITIWRNDRQAAALPQASLIFQLKLMRTKRPRAFRWLVLKDSGASQLAVAGGIEDPATQANMEQRLRDDWGSIDEAGVLRKVRMCRDTLPVSTMLALAQLGALRAAITKYAPHHLPLIPDKIGGPDRPLQRSDPFAEVQDQITRLHVEIAATHKPPSRALAPDALAAARAASPAVQRALAHQQAAAARDAWTPPWEA